MAHFIISNIIGLSPPYLTAFFNLLLSNVLKSFVGISEFGLIPSCTDFPFGIKSEPIDSFLAKQKNNFGS